MLADLLLSLSSFGGMASPIWIRQEETTALVSGGSRGLDRSRVQASISVSTRISHTQFRNREVLESLRADGGFSYRGSIHRTANGRAGGGADALFEVLR